jgi:hypothetical protein
MTSTLEGRDVITEVEEIAALHHLDMSVKAIDELLHRAQSSIHGAIEMARTLGLADLGASDIGKFMPRMLTAELEVEAKSLADYINELDQGAFEAAELTAHQFLLAIDKELVPRHNAIRDLASDAC